MRVNEINYPGADQYEPDALSKVGSHPIERPEPLVKVRELAYLMWEKPNLDRAAAFMTDFGLQTVQHSSPDLYMRGTGSAPWFYHARTGRQSKYLGAGFIVDDIEDLKKMAKQTDSPIEQIDAPGGGSRLRLEDPDGFQVDLIADRTPSNELDCPRVSQPINTPWEKKRINRTQRPALQATPVVKLGHVVIQVSNFSVSQQWYMQHLGLIPTDVLCLEDGTPTLAFNRTDRGSEPSDHHTLVIAQGPETKCMHSAYETLDIDSIGQGQQYLKLKGWKHFWGLGRHILGSQIFDYWLDPDGDEFEHYADGDVFDANYPTGYHLLDRGGLWQWGHDLPEAMKPKPTAGQVFQLVLDLISKRVKLADVKLTTKAMNKKPRPWLN